MDLTSDQKKNLVHAYRLYMASKVKFELAQKDLAAKLDKLKTCCNASGQEAQVLQEAHNCFAQAFLSLPEGEWS